MEFEKLNQRAIEIRAQYAELEQRNHGRAWTNEEIALGFVGDVGDLAKLVLAKNDVRNIPDANEKLAHELADCLWSILVLAHDFRIDIEQEFLNTMNDLEKHIAAQK